MLSTLRKILTSLTRLQWGQAAFAATAIHNQLRQEELEDMLRQMRG